MIQFLDLIVPEERVEQTLSSVDYDSGFPMVWAILGVVFALMVCFALVWKFRRAQCGAGK